MRSDSSRSDSSGTDWAISPKRSVVRRMSTLTIAPVQRRPMSSIASW